MGSCHSSNNSPMVSRRDLLKKTLTTAPAALLAGPLSERTAAAHGPGGKPPRTGTVAGIDPTDLVGQYAARRLDDLSDAELYGQVAAIVSRPLGSLTSFTLHAPLELMARYGLLPLVEPRERRLARLQMLASGSVYASAAGAIDLPRPMSAFVHLSAAREELTRTLRSADADRLDAIVL